MIGESSFEQTAQAFSENQYSQEEKLFVQFFIHPKQNATKSLEAGRPIYDDTEYVRIITPGDKDNIVERPAKLADHQRFARQYQAFKQGLTDPVVSGTPLRMWPIMSRAMVEELAYFKVFTVEQLADLPDNLAGQFMGIQRFKQAAKDFVEAAKSTAPLEQMRKALEEKDAQLAGLGDKLQKALARIDALEEANAEE